MVFDMEIGENFAQFSFNEGYVLAESFDGLEYELFFTTLNYDETYNLDIFSPKDSKELNEKILENYLMIKNNNFKFIYH